MRRALLIAIASVTAIAACGSKGPDMPANVGAASWAAPLKPLPSPIVVPPPDTTPKGLDGHVLVNVPDAGIGPFLARRGNVVMAAYVGATDDGRRVIALPLAASGEPRSDAKVIAPIAPDATTLILRATGGDKAGFVAAWTSLTDRGEALSIVGVRDDGRPAGEPQELARSTEAIAWVGVAPTKSGAIVAWAEQPKAGGDADVLAAAIGPDGAMRGVPSRVARGVHGWQLVATGDGAGLALVRRAANDAKKQAVMWVALDSSARPSGGPITVATTRVGGDVDAAWTHDGALVAWTDLSTADPAPMIARVGTNGRVDGPKRATVEGAGGALVAIAPDAIAWEEPFRRGRPGRRVMIARVDASKGASVGEPLALELDGRGDPEIAKTVNGFALLAPARACAAAAASCDDAPVAPMFARFDAREATLRPTQVEPLRLGILREQASAAWSLACDADSAACLALAVTGDATAPKIDAVDLGARTSGYRAPIAPEPPPGSPMVEAIDTALPSGALADLASTRLGDGAMVATIGAGNEETKRDDVSSVTVRAFPGNGAPGAPVVITKRALPVGGVSIAATGNGDDGAAVAWVGRDAGDPQVHVTRVDRSGKVLRDVQLTSAKGDASDVAIAWTGDAWLVGWVDARDGNGEVYAAVLDRDGHNVGKGQRITNAPGDASDVSLFVSKGAALVAWADPRESPSDGFADIYVAPLRAKDGALAGDETRVLATAAHSRSPVMAADASDVALAWIEEAPSGADASRSHAYGALLARVDARGHVKGDPAQLATAGGGFPTAVALDAAGAELHAVLARAAPDALILDALDASARDPRAFPILTMDGPPSLDVALSLQGRSLFFNDEGAEAEQDRARRAVVRW